MIVTFIISIIIIITFDTNELLSCTIGEAIKKPGSRVPYVHGGFTVENLPDGIIFKKPFHYGTKQLQVIMEKKSEIKFVINTNETCKAAQMLPPWQLALKQ